MLQWVLLAAVVAVGAFAVSSGFRVAELRKDLDSYRTTTDLLDRKRPEHEMAVKSLAAQVTQLDISFKDETARLAAELAKATRPVVLTGVVDGRADGGTGRVDGGQSSGLPMPAELSDLREWARRHFIASAQESADARQLLTEIAQYTVDQLARDAREGVRVLQCRLYARQPAVADIAPLLLAELQAALAMEQLYREPDGSRFFVTWPDHRQQLPAPALRALLSSALDLAQAEPQPGTNELRAVLFALDEGGPSLLQVGPLLIARTHTELSAGLVHPGWAGPSVHQLQVVLSGDQPGLLHYLGAADVLDLTGWAVPRAA